MFGPEDENDLLSRGMVGSHSTAGAVMAFIEKFNSTRRNVNSFDTCAVENCSRRIATSVVDDPLAIGRPDGRIGEDMAVRGSGDLARKS